MRRVAVALLSGCALVLCGCAPAGLDSGANAPEGSEVIALAVDHRAQWRELRIEGTTDLSDGAVVSYRVTHALATELPPGEWPAQNLIADGTAVVQAGQFWARLNTTYWPRGAVRVQVEFPVAPQPDDVRVRYGEFGEHLTGENVKSLGASKVVTAEHAFDWTP